MSQFVFGDITAPRELSEAEQVARVTRQQAGIAALAQRQADVRADQEAPHVGAAEREKRKDRLNGQNKPAWQR